MTPPLTSGVTLGLDLPASLWQSAALTSILQIVYLSLAGIGLSEEHAVRLRYACSVMPQEASLVRIEDASYKARFLKDRPCKVSRGRLPCRWGGGGLLQVWTLCSPCQMSANLCVDFMVLRVLGSTYCVSLSSLCIVSEALRKAWRYWQLLGGPHQTVKGLQQRWRAQSRPCKLLQSCL